MVFAIHIEHRRSNSNTVKVNLSLGNSDIIRVPPRFLSPNDSLAEISNRIARAANLTYANLFFFTKFILINIVPK